jgi:hypothetical protein
LAASTALVAALSSAPAGVSPTADVAGPQSAAVAYRLAIVVVPPYSLAGIVNPPRAPMQAATLVFRPLLALVLVLTASIASALAGGRHADPNLEALLPETLGGVALTRESQAGSEVGTQSAAFDAFLASLGKSRADFALASAYSQGGLKAEVGAWQVRGADPSKLLPQFESAVQAASTTPLTIAEETLAGRRITRIGDPGQLTQGPLYVVVRGDALLFVQTPERALAAEAIAKLPEWYQPR